MNRAAVFLAGLASSLLAPPEREVILGDLDEAGESPWQALVQIVGLVARRQVLLWKTWRPWLAGFAVAMPGALALMGFSLRVSSSWQLYAWIVRDYRYMDPAILSQTGLGPARGLSLLAIHIFLLAGWSWSGGFVVGSVSRRTLWVSAALALAPCAFCLLRFRGHTTLSRFCLLIFLLPAVWGVRRGLQRLPVARASALSLALLLTVVALIPWDGRSTGIVGWALCWPAWYMALASNALKEQQCR